MPDLSFQTNTDTWGLAASSGQTTLTFSGYLTKNAITEQKAAASWRRVRKITLWTIAILGIISLALHIYLTWSASGPEAVLGHSPLTAVFWISILCDLYLWAILQQDRLNGEKLNLFNFESLHGNTGSASLDIYELFNEPAQRTWARTFDVSQKNKHQIPDSFDLFLALLDEPQVRMVFARLGVFHGDVITLIKNYLVLHGEGDGGLQRVPFIAFNESIKLHNKAVDPLMLLIALVMELPPDHLIANILFNLNVDLEKLETICSWVFTVQMLSDNLKVFRRLSRFKPDKGVNQGMTSVPTPYLDHFSQDLTIAAKYGHLPIAWGRTNDLADMFALLGEGSRNLIIKGGHGTGRTTLINELSYKMATEQVPKMLQDKRLVKLELAGILGTADKAENVFTHCLQEAERSGNIIIVMEEIHDLAKVSSSQGLSMLELLVNYLQQSSLQVLGTTTLEDDVDYLQKAGNFSQVFASYELQPLTHTGILLASCIRASFLEFQSKCFFRYQAIEQAVNLSDVYIKGEGQPQKTISVLTEAASRMKNNPDKYKVVTEEVIQKIVSDKTHVPTEALGESEAEKLLNLEDELQKYIIGQHTAVKAVCEALRRARSGLASGSRPLASFLFLGPTGVGKTELTKTLAATYFGQEKFLLRMDMSEFHGPEGLSKLLGTESSKLDTPLIKHLKNYPFCLILLDEFEKASPEVWNIFLQILDDGRLTTAKGELLDLTHTMIIATSNAGTKEIQDGLKNSLGMDQIKNRLFSQTLVNIFPPELLNRFDGIILFSPLSPEEVERITTLQLQSLTKQLLAKGIKISFTDSVVKDISTNAFDPLLGARPIRRYIQDHVEGFVAKLILRKDLARGSEITVDMQNGELVVI